MRALRAALLPACLAVVLWAAWVVPLPVFVERPGSLLSLAEHVEVEVDHPSEIDGDFLLTVANLRRATTVDALQALFEDDAGFIRQERIIPPGVDDEAYFERQRDVFQESVEVAAAVGLRAAGYQVDPEALSGEGAVVLGVVPGLAAAGVLEPGDVIVAAGGAPVGTARDLSAAVLGAEEVLEIRFLRNGEERTAALAPERRATGGQARPVIGVEIQTLRPRIDLPVPVRVASGRIGGPSAGLLIALTVFDKAAEDVDLTAGRQVAGTGGMGASGIVEPVGGISAKIVSAHRAGADVFLVPAAQQQTAVEALPRGSPVRIVPVSSFDEAVEALRDGAATLAYSDRSPALGSPGGRR